MNRSPALYVARVLLALAAVASDCAWAADAKIAAGATNRSGRLFGRRWIADGAAFALMALHPRAVVQQARRNVLSSVARDKTSSGNLNTLSMCVKRGKPRHND